MEIKFINTITKPKIPKEYTYILKSTQLDNLLLKNKFNIYTDLTYWLPKEVGSIFEAHYWEPSNNISYQRLYIRAGALLKAESKQAREILSENVFPVFVNWLNMILRLENNSYYFNQQLYFEAIYINNRLELNINPEIKII